MHIKKLPWHRLKTVKDSKTLGPYSLDSETLAYLAGLIDGEGCIYLYWREGKAHGDRYLRIKVGLAIHLTDKILIDWINKLFEKSGTTYSQKRVANHRTLYSARIEGFRLYPWVVALLPYIKLKKQQFRVLAKYFSHQKTRYLEQNRKCYKGRGPYLKYNQLDIALFRRLDARCKHLKRFSKYPKRLR